MTGQKPHKPNRRNVPLFVMLPPEERDRVITFAGTIGRPFSWVVRDALRVYLDAVQQNAEKLATLQAKVKMPELNAADAGTTPPSRRGRPHKPKGSSVPAK